MSYGRERSRRRGKVLASLIGTLLLGGCGLVLLPHETSINNTHFNSYAEVSAAYASVVNGKTDVSQLSRIGFDPTNAANMEVLSYLGVIERFMPRDSIHYDRLDPRVRGCIEARENCSAFVFRPQQLEQERNGNIILDILGFERSTRSHGWSADVTFLVENGRVAYKVIAGRPNIEDLNDNVQPLGPFQDIGGTAVRTAARML